MGSVATKILTGSGKSLSGEKNRFCGGRDLFRSLSTLCVIFCLFFCLLVGARSLPAFSAAALPQGYEGPRGFGNSKGEGDETLRRVRVQIAELQRELTDSRERRSGSAAQLKKIRRLMSLQGKEILLSEKRIGQLNARLEELSRRRAEVARHIDQQKQSIRKRLLDLVRLTGVDHFGDSLRIAGFLEALHFDLFAQKSYFLRKSLARDLAEVAKLQSGVQEALALELQILEERNKLDYYVLELKDKASELGANQRIHQEILKSNQENHLEALNRIHALRESERELERMLGQFQLKARQPAQSTLVALKGKLDLPVSGDVISQFGRFFNPKTNLLTFQKGIAISAAPDSDVKAVHEGQVVYKGDLKDYGAVVIVEHPGQYFSLYGQLSRVAVNEGEIVRAGDKIGATSKEPFYFEIREKNVAVNPMGWFNAGTLAYSKRGT